MADIKLTTIAGGSGIPPPTALTMVVQAGLAGMRNVPVTHVGAEESSAITSATLTEVLNISGSGVLSYLGMTTTTATAANPSLFRVVIDGAQVLDETGINLLETQFAGVVGSTTNNPAISTQGLVTFNSSLVISIAGDGVNGVKAFWKKYLT